MNDPNLIPSIDIAQAMQDKRWRKPMTKCDGCGCPLDPNLDIILQERVTLPGAGETRYEYRNYCSASCLEDHAEQMSQGRVSRAIERVISPPNWRVFR